MTATLINVDNLSLVRGNRCLFNNLSFSVDKGQALHLCGRNGSGKTSLLKVLTGIIPPTFGQLSVFGRSPKAFEAQDFQRILYLGHQTAIKPQLTVMENLTLQAELFDQLLVNNEQLQQALEAVGLWAFREQKAARLSAGQARRITLARLWVALPEGNYDSKKTLWLLDEPLTALDTQFIDRLQQHIAKHLDVGGGIVFTSHQPLVLGREVDRLNLDRFQG